MSIERHFDVPLIAALALREKQVQQNYRPVIAVHKWFARRPGALFRGLVLAEFGDRALPEAFFRANAFPGRVVADPFMGGGTPLIEANRVGCDVIGWDINPMAWWIVRQELQHIDVAAYREAAGRVHAALSAKLGDLYRTSCEYCGSQAAIVKYFLWVKVQACGSCAHEADLFPGYLIAENKRHPKNVLVCPGCGQLNEVQDRKQPGQCRNCAYPLTTSGPVRRGRCRCSGCGTDLAVPDARQGPPRHRLFALEYSCPSCRNNHQGRFFKTPKASDLDLMGEAKARWNRIAPRFVPDDEIPAGDETDRLHRWGYSRYREMFNERQLLGLETLCGMIAEQENGPVKEALATNVSDLLRYQNMLCRYDTMALKSLDIFSVHGFPVGLIACESNLLGIARGGGAVVGSGGWLNIVEKYARAKDYCERPFEVAILRGNKSIIAVPGERIGAARDGDNGRKVVLHAASATEATMASESLDAVMTDPPYFGNVQYAELMDFCYVWLRRLATTPGNEFSRLSTRNPAELTANATLARGAEHFTDGLSTVFRNMAAALKPGAPFVFTYHHNRLDAYYPAAVALLDAGLTCSATLPCPAEMGGSIHIAGTGSSIVDTVFVARRTGSVQRSSLPTSIEGIADIVRRDLEQLRAAGLEPTQGDIRCIVFGHLIRLAIWNLRPEWDASRPTATRLADVGAAVISLGGSDAVLQALKSEVYAAPFAHYAIVGESGRDQQALDDAIPF